MVKITLEEIAKPCTWKVAALDENSTTFHNVKMGHKLYNCIECPGTKGSCPNYSDYNKIKDKYHNE